MSDMIDAFRDMKRLRKLERERLGHKCPDCIEKLPKANPKVLLPGQICRAHKPHYRDPRQELTAAEYNAAMEGTGWSRKS